MATELRRRTPLGALADELAAVCAGEGFRCHEDAFRTLTEIRCAGGGETEARGAVAAELPPLLRMTVDGDRSVVSLGPNWWLVDAPDGSRPVAGSELVSAVDSSAQRTPLVLAGPQARDVLMHGCSIDVHPEHFAMGDAVQTLLAKAAVILARTGADEYRVWVRASFARYLAAWIIDASVEYR